MELHFCCTSGVVLLLIWPCRLNANLLICRNTADSIFEDNYHACKETAEKINSLKEQVRQLQNIVAAGDHTDQRNRYHGVPADCGEILQSGIKTSGVYMISPDGRCPFKVYCDMTDDGWTVIQRRVDGTVNFYRKWDEYVEGFGDIDGEYWLGLEKIHRLTKEGYQILFELENYEGTTDYAHYKSFIVHDVTSVYKMNIDAFGYNGTVDELFSYHDNQKFSTFDRDNDSNGGNCAITLDGGGWWYKDCYMLGNLNGVFGKKVQHGLGYWHTTKRFVPIKSASVKVKQRKGFC